MCSDTLIVMVFRTWLSLVPFLVLSTVTGCSFFSPSINPNSLYAKLGGEPRTRKLVDTLMVNLMVDPRINSYFMAVAADKERLITLKDKMFDQVCALTGGPCTYAGKSMQDAHGHLRVSDQHFDIFIENFKLALFLCEVDPEAKEALLKAFAELRPEIVL